MAINKKLIRKWVKALRSGKYKQGSEALRNGDTYCCLGVLCDVIDPSGWKDKSLGFYYDEKCDVLPQTVCDMAGIEESNPIVGGKGLGLAEYNDGDEDAGRKPYSFKRIATLIENKWLKGKRVKVGGNVE